MQHWGITLKSFSVLLDVTESKVKMESKVKKNQRDAWWVPPFATLGPEGTPIHKVYVLLWRVGFLSGLI